MAGYSLQDIFRAGFSLIQCREIWEAASGLKTSRLHVTKEQLQWLFSWSHTVGVHLITADFKVKEEGDEGKGSWHNTGIRTSLDDEGWYYVYLDRNAERLRLARFADEQGDHETFGELLRIPRCCRRFFIAHKAEAIAHYADDYVVIILRNTPWRLPFPFQTNYLSQYFGFSLISHYPCSFSCQATLERAQESYDIIRRVSTTLADRIVEAIKCMVIHENLQGVHTGRVEKLRGQSLSYSPSSLDSTRPNAFFDLLKTNSTISWKSPFEFWVGNTTINSDKLGVPALLLFN